MNNAEFRNEETEQVVNLTLVEQQDASIDETSFGPNEARATLLAPQVNPRGPVVGYEHPMSLLEAAKQGVDPKKIIGGAVVPDNPFPVGDVDFYQVGFEPAGFLPKQMLDGQIYQLTHRAPLYEGDKRLIAGGAMTFAQHNLHRRWTHADIDVFKWGMEGAMATLQGPENYPFPEKALRRVVDEFDGVLPIMVASMTDGQAHYVGEPQIQVATNVKGMGELCGWIESQILPAVWSQTRVATQGRHIKEAMMDKYRKAHGASMSEEQFEFFASINMHDFGARGGVDSMKTGSAHFYNFNGSDTVKALLYSSIYLNGGQKFGAGSVLAAAHKTITCHPTEEGAYVQHLIGNGKMLSDKDSNAAKIISIVADTYNYENACEILTKNEIRDAFETLGGKLVIRPDSGDPVECVLHALETAKKNGWGSDSPDGLILFNNFGVIQGDGIDEAVVMEILDAVMEAGFSPLNCVFGMGEKNHQAMRSDVESAFKLCGTGSEKLGWSDAMKKAKNEFKLSLPGPVGFNPEAKHRIYPITPKQFFEGDFGPGYRVLFNGIPDSKLERDLWDLNETRELCYNSYTELEKEPEDTISPEIRKAQREFLEKMGVEV